VNPIGRLFIKGHVALYRATGGRRGGSIRGMKVILLTTTGAKTGQARTVPVVPFVDGNDTYVMASMGGAPQHPAWFVNLQKTPDVAVQREGNEYAARAVILPEGPERDRVWSRIVASMPNFGEYQTKTSRVIPVVKLERKAS
jgi:deazaflavin-dependent oxidoreductase (nitroreductase family)